MISFSVDCCRYTKYRLLHVRLFCRMKINTFCTLCLPLLQFFPVLKYYADFILVLATLWSATSWLLKCYFFRFSLRAFAIDIVVLLILPVIKGEKKQITRVLPIFQMLQCYVLHLVKARVGGELYDRKLFL